MPVKKASIKPKKQASVQTQNLSEIEKVVPQEKSVFVTKKYQLLTGAIVAVLLIGLFVFKNLFIVATVNGEPIYRLSVIKELERQGGKQTINAMVMKALILQEAKKQQVTVSDAEIQEEIKKTQTNVEKQGQKFEEALAGEGLTKEIYKEQLKTEKLIEKMVAKDVKVSDSEVTDYIEANKEAFSQTPDQNQLKKTIVLQLRQQKVQAKFQSWITDLQKKANISYFTQY